MAKRKDTTPVSALRASQLDQEEKNVSTQQTAASKQDERKQREAQKGPVSVLKAEQLNSAAQSGRAVSAQLTEQEFNRSTALQKSYGNYLNYTLGRKVTGGGFYSRPGIGQDQLDSVERLKLATQNYQQAMVGLDQAYKALRPQTLRSSSAAKLPTLKDAAGGGLTLPRVNPIPEKQTIRNNVNPALDRNLQNQFHNAYALATAAEDAYREAESNYKNLTRSAEEQDKAWKSTIRDQASIQADIDEIDRQINALWRKRNENDRTMVGTNDPMGVRNLGNAQYLTNYLNAKGENERIDKLIENLRDDQNLLREELEWSHYFQWSGYRDQQIPVSAQRMGTLKKNQEAAKNDPMYTILTGEGNVGQAMIARENPGSARTLAGEDLSTMAFISDEERETYKAIYEQRGPEVAAQYYRELKELSLNTRRRQAEEAEMRAFADSAPVTASVASILAGPMQAVAYIAQAVDMLDGRLERDAAYNRITYLRNAARGEIAQNFQDNLGETWGKYGSFGYQTAMSMGDFLFNAAVTGGFSGGNGNFALGLMGTEAAADATMQALDRGLSDKQAFALGTVAGLAEVVTEKVSLEALLDKLGMEQGFRYFLKNVFAEGSEELGSDIINLAADAWISKDRSEWQQAIRDYQTMGKTREEAFRQAWIDQLMQTGASFLGGALSGGAMAGGSLALNAVVSAEYSSAQGEAMLADENEMQRVISQGLESPADSEAYKRAKALQEKLAAGQTVTPGEAGRAHFATQDQVYRDLKSESAEIIGRRLMVPDGDAVLKNAIGVGLEIEETRAMAERMADKYMDGTLTAKDAGEMFLATQKALDAQAQTEQEIAEREQSAYEAAELLGVEIELFDQAATTYERDGKTYESTVNGYFDRATGKIRINRNAADPIMQVVSHELTHGLEQTENYSRLMDVVREQTPDMDSAIRERVERYRRAGVELTDEDAVHEIVAEYVQKNLLNDEKTIRAFAKRDRSLAGWILRQIDKVLAKLGDTSAQERVTLEKARGIYADALREVQEDGRLRLPKVESGQAASVTGKRFSMSEPVEVNRSLVAMHNLSAENLGKALDLGGFPMPSIAVTKRTIPHTNFGDITLVMNRSTVDPEMDSRNKVFSADVWSPTFPKIEYETDTRTEKKIQKKYYELYNKYGDKATRALYPWGNYPADELNRRGGEAGLMEYYKRDPDMKRLYVLDTQGKEVQDVYDETVERLPKERIDQYDRMIEILGEEVFRDFEPQGQEKNSVEAIPRWEAAHMDEYKAAMEQFFIEKGLDAETVQDVVDNTNRRDVLSQAKNILNYLKKGPEKKTTRYNAEKTWAAIDAAVDQKGYEDWLHGLFDGIEKGRGIYNGSDYYDEMGYERGFAKTHYPVTLQNIVRAMQKQNDGNLRNTSGFVGAKTLRGATALSFSSVDQMHENEDRLRNLTEEEAEQINQEFNDRLAALIANIYDSREHGWGDNRFIEFDHIGGWLADAAENNAQTVEDLRRSVEKAGYQVDEQTGREILKLFDDISKMPVHIFEGKPQRVVRFDEVMAAVVPEGTSRELIDALRGAGVENVMEYEPENTEDRLAKVNSVPEAAFSITERESSEYKDAVDRGDMETAQRLVDEAAKKAGYDSPKLYHGTPYFGFTKIDTKQSDDGLSFFTTSDLKLAQTYSGKWDVTEIGVLPEQRKFNSRDPQKILQALRENNRLFDAKYFPAEHGAELDDFANTVLSRLTNRLEDEGYFNSGIEKAEWLWDAIQAFYKENSKTTREKLFGRLFAIEDDFRYNIVDEMITQMELVLNIYGETEDVYWYLGDYHHIDQALSLLRGDRRGNYAFYGKTDGLKTIEGRRAQWFNILVDGKEKNTRQIAREAYKEGFLGVRIKEIIDNGGRGASHVNAGDVYVYFDGTCLKSADPVTYDDDGNVIPLEERFNPENKDIRYDITESEVKGLELPSVEGGRQIAREGLGGKAAVAAPTGEQTAGAETETDGRLRLPKVEDNILKDETYTMASRLRYDAARKAAQYMIDNARDEDERAEGEDAMRAAERLLEKKPAKKAPEEVKPYDPIESRKRLTNKLLDTFQVEREARAGVRQNIEELSERLLGKEYYDEADLGELYSRLRYYGRGTIPADPYYESVRETLKGKKLYLDKSTRVDFGDDYAYWKKRAAAVGIYFTTDLKNRDARDMIPELNKDFPGIFQEDMTDPRDIIETMVENAELGMPRTVPMDEYEEWVRKQTGQSAEVQEAERWEEVKRAVDAYLDAANVEQILRGRKTLQTKAAAEPEAGPDFMRDIYQMSDAEIDNYINLMEEPVRTETDLLDRVTEPENRKIKAEDAPGAFLGAYAQLTGGFEGPIPGTEMVSTGTKAKAKTRGGVKDAGRYFYRKMVDSGEAVSRLGKYAKAPSLYHFYNMARASSNAAVSMIQDAQTNVRGEKVGESLNNIFKTIRDKGQEYYANLQAYLLHMHNIDRMSREDPAAVLRAQEELEQFKKDNPELANMADFQIAALANDPISNLNEQAQLYTEILNRLSRASMTRNKPVFDSTVDAETSRQAVQELLNRLEDVEGFEEDVQNIYSYIDHLMEYRIESGLITEEDYRHLKEIYPHYVPVFYETEIEGQPTRRKDRTEIGKTIGRAKGNETMQKIMPLHKSLAKQTFSVVREGSKNRFGTMLLDLQQQSRGMIQDVQKYAGDFHEDTFDDEHRDDEFKKTNRFIVREDGQRWEMTLDNAMYEAVDVLSPEPEEVNMLTKVIRGSNELFKALCTGYNPTFLVRNFMRDLQDAGLYSKDLSEFVKNYPLAVKEIATNGKYWQQYKALGGLYSSIFDYQTGELKQSNKFKRYTFDKIEAVNMAVEQAPRLAEFMATVKKAERAGNLTMDTLMEAMYNAADVTVNFGRSGKIGKYLNRNFVPFLNPGIQGFDKMIRNVTETRGFKNWTRLVAKCALLGIVPTVITKMLFGKRKDWDEIKQRDKDIYYLFPLDDNGHWLKLPKGRTLSIFGMATDRVMNQIEGKDTDWIGLLTTSLEQTAPANPLTNNIWQPIVGTKLFNPYNPGETWYGTDIESKRLQNLAPEERYDASTSKISIFLGRTFKLSPAKINYLLDQYSGVLGDIILPLTSARAEKDLFSAAFTVDTETSNRLSGDFYEKLDELTYQKNDPKAEPESAAVYRYFNKASSDVSEINKVIRSIEEDESLSDKEKLELTRVQYALRNEVMRSALENVGQYAETAKRTYAETGDGDEAYRAANREMFGAEYALRLYDKSVYETAQEMNRDSGIEYENFYQFYFGNKEITAEGAEGTRERIGLIRQQNIEDEQKRALYEKYVSNSDESKGNWDFITEFGISADEYLAFKAETHGMNQGDTLRYLADADMSEKTKLGIVATVKGETTLEKPDGTQTKMGKLLEMADEGVPIDDGIRALAAGGIDEYDKAMKNGLNPQAAMRSAELATQIKEGAEIKNSLGYCIEAVQTIENDQDMLCAMAGFMDDSEFEKVRVGMELDVEPRLYVEAKARVQDVLDEVRQQPGMENKGLDQEIAKQALDAMSCSNQEKAVLWQLLNKSWKPGKNPYGNGNAAYDALHRTEEEIDGTLRLPSIG